MFDGKNISARSHVHCIDKSNPYRLVLNVAGFPVLFMYFSRRLVPAFKSCDHFECACNGERRQAL